MGIDPNQVPDSMRRLMDREGRAVLAKVHPNLALTSDECVQKQFKKLERDEQAALAEWLRQQENNGVLVYDWSRTDRRTTNRSGMPDFRIYKGARALLGEMKLYRERLSKEQLYMHEKFLRAGSEVEVWSCAEVARRRIKNWIWTEFREWSWGGEPEILE